MEVTCWHGGFAMFAPVLASCEAGRLEDSPGALPQDLVLSAEGRCWQSLAKIYCKNEIWWSFLKDLQFRSWLFLLNVMLFKRPGQDGWSGILLYTTGPMTWEEITFSPHDIDKMQVLTAELPVGWLISAPSYLMHRFFEWLIENLLQVGGQKRLLMIIMIMVGFTHSYQD